MNACACALMGMMNMMGVRERYMQLFKVFLSSAQESIFQGRLTFWEDTASESEVFQGKKYFGVKCQGRSMRKSDIYCRIANSINRTRL